MSVKGGGWSFSPGGGEGGCMIRRGGYTKDGFVTGAIVYLEQLLPGTTHLGSGAMGYFIHFGRRRENVGIPATVGVYGG